MVDRQRSFARRVPGLRRRLRDAWVALACSLALLAPGTAAAALDPADRAAVGAAFRLAGRDDWPRALQIIAEVEEPLPAKALRWLRMMEEREPADFDTLASFLLDNPDWPWPEELQIIAEGTITDPANHELIRRLFADRAPLTTRGTIRYAEALFKVDQDEAATALIRRAWVEGDFSAGEEQKFYRRYQNLLTRQDHIARLDNLLWDYRRRSASRMLERVPDGYRRLAVARMALQRRARGVDEAIVAVPSELLSDPGLIFDRMRWRRQKRRHADVVELLLDPPDQLVHPARWWFERELQIRRALRSRDFDLAYRLASRHGQTAGEEFATAEWLAGWLALRFIHQPNTALRHFNRLYEAAAAPVIEARAAYWIGRSHAALGDREQAMAWYQRSAAHPIAWYGQLAAEELGRDFRPTSPRPEADAAARAAFENSELVRLVRILIDADVPPEQISPFLIRLADLASDSAEVGLVAELAASGGRPHLVAQTGRFAAYYGHVNEAAAFPVPDLPRLVWPPAGEPEAALLLGIARQESVFNPLASSHAGAQGLLQLIPRTAYLMAHSLGLPYNEGLLTGDPDYNIRLGSHYMRTLLARYGGETALAAAAYNAGPSRVDEWLRLHGDPRQGDRYAVIDWIELIPFDETRNYVERVLEGRNMYRRRLADDKLALIPFRPVNGPLDPVPAPLLKPGGEAGEIAVVASPAAAPRPKLKPVDETQIIPAGFAVPRPKLKPADRVALADDPAADGPLPELKPASQT